MSGFISSSKIWFQVQAVKFEKYLCCLFETKDKRQIWLPVVVIWLLFICVESKSCVMYIKWFIQMENVRTSRWIWKSETKPPYFFIRENDPSCTVQRRLEGEAPQVVVVLQVDVIPLHHQSRSWWEKHTPSQIWCERTAQKGCVFFSKLYLHIKNNTGRFSCSRQTIINMCECSSCRTGGAYIRAITELESR